jgi:nucleotide-binding universal stress UspA family protein
MLRRIMTPTDGSPESEKALPLAAQIARAQDAELIVASVIDEPALASPGWGATSNETYQEIMRENENAVRAYLADIEARLAAEGVRVYTAVRQGPAAAALLDWEAAEHPDLLVMATHGRSGVARFALGSVAERMVREGSTPVLLVRTSTPPRVSLETALVMLDGSDVAEQALSMVEQLAGKPLQSVTLFRAVADPDDRGTALTYLQGVAARLERAGLQATPRVDVGEPRRTVKEAAPRSDFVVLCTHGRSGFDRLRHGSVAESVIRELDRPTLVVRAQSSSISS